MTIREYIAKAKSVQTSVKGYVDDIALMKEDEIINLNVTQMQSGYGTNDQRLEYPFEDFTGKYASRTVGDSLKRRTVLPKSLGAFYNFGASGDFLANFKVKITKENKYFGTLINVTPPSEGTVVYGQSMSGLAGFYAVGTFTFPDVNQAGVVFTKPANLFAVSSTFVESLSN